MRTTLLRFAASVAAAIALFSVADIGVAPNAHAAPEVAAEDAFVMKVFPHDGNAIPNPSSFSL